MSLTDSAGVDTIRGFGAHEHNLPDISLSISKNKITVFTGVSGSGKSSIVFDTIAVESSAGSTPPSRRSS